MCGVKSKMLYPDFGTGFARLVVLVLFLLCVVSPLSAAADWFFLGGGEETVESVQVESLPSVTVQEVTKEQVQEDQPVLVADSEPLQTPSTNYSGTSLDKLTQDLKALSTTAQNSMLTSSEVKQGLIELQNNWESYKKLEEVEDEALYSALDAISALESSNSEQADNIARLTERLDSATSTKAYGRVGGVIGFDNLEPIWGITGALGVRFGESFLTEVGASYMLGSFTKPIDLTPSLDKLQISASVGWEW